MWIFALNLTFVILPTLTAASSYDCSAKHGWVFSKDPETWVQNSRLLSANEVPKLLFKTLTDKAVVAVGEQQAILLSEPWVLGSMTYFSYVDEIRFLSYDVTLNTDVFPFELEYRVSEERAEKLTLYYYNCYRRP